MKLRTEKDFFANLVKFTTHELVITAIEIKTILRYHDCNVIININRLDYEYKSL